MDASEYLKPGMKDKTSFRVGADYTAAFVGSGSLDVLATPSMIAFMERVAHGLLERHLPEGYSSVGLWVDVRHLAPTPSGFDVFVECEILEVSERRVTLALKAWDEQGEVGEGRHQRVVIDIARFMKRVDEKRLK